MEDWINNLKNAISMQYWIYTGIGILLIVVLTIVIFSLRKRKARKDLANLELMYANVRGVPLAFKLNKAVALSRVSGESAEIVETCQQDFNNIQDKLKQTSMSLAEMDDAIYSHKSGTALKRIEDVQKEIEACEVEVNKLNEVLDQILEQESEQRSNINKLKEEFRKMSQTLEASRQVYALCEEYLNEEFVNVEKQFSSFEEWMFASEFQKAAKVQEEIRDRLEHIKTLLKEMPTLYEQIKVDIPKAIDECSYEYSRLKSEGVHLAHLDIRKNLEVITDILKKCMGEIRNGKVDDIQVELNECATRIFQLKEQMQLENDAHHEVYDSIEELFTNIKQLNKEVEDIHSLYKRVYERFGFENWNEKLSEVEKKLEILNDMKRRLEKIILEKAIPATTVSIAYKELKQGYFSFYKDVATMSEKLQKACSDEERAQKQLVKLGLILNEVRVKILKHHLPSVSQKYNDDVRTASNYIKDIKNVLKISPLDVKTLNDKLRVAIDYTYTLYNSVNNLVGMAVMVENAIVFGNRYRVDHQDIDSELTRAELCFRNGEYTKALKIGIQAIEKLYPGAYEKLLHNNKEYQAYTENRTSAEYDLS